MIQFRKLVICNFLSFGEKQVIPLYNQGIVRIEGRNLDEGDSNRAGKSAILEALIWALFGRTIREVKHDEVVNRFAKKNCYVAVSFISSDVLYRVKRYRRHEKFGNKLLTWRADKLISYRHEDESQRKLEHILGCDFRLFANSVVFGGVKPFASLTDSEQKKVFESFLHFEEFDEALTFTRSHISKVKEKINDIQIVFSQRREAAKSAKEKIETIKISQRAAAGEKNRELKLLFRKCKRLLVGPTKQGGLDFRRIEGCREIAKAASSAVTVCEQEIKSLKKGIQRIARQMEGDVWLQGKLCPTCGQKITEQSQEAYQAHLRREKIQLERTQQDLSQKASQLRKEEIYAEQKLERLLKKKREAELQNLQLQHLEERIEELRSQIRSSVLFEKELEDAILGYGNGLVRFLNATLSNNILVSKLETLSFWETGFGNKGIKSLIIKQALPALNTKLQEYTREIFGNAATIEFVPTKETKNGEERDLFHIRYTAKRGADSYKGESSGGRKRIDICILLVLSWLSRTSNILLVDELLDSLDQAGREIVLEILSKQRGTILVISHRKELNGGIGKTWVVTKENGFSKVNTDA